MKPRITDHETDQVADHLANCSVIYVTDHLADHLIECLVMG